MNSVSKRTHSGLRRLQYPHHSAVKHAMQLPTTGTDVDVNGNDVEVDGTEEDRAVLFFTVRRERVMAKGKRRESEGTVQR